MFWGHTVNTYIFWTALLETSVSLSISFKPWVRLCGYFIELFDSSIASFIFLNTVGGGSAEHLRINNAGILVGCIMRYPGDFSHMFTCGVFPELSWFLFVFHVKYFILSLIQTRLQTKTKYFLIFVFLLQSPKLLLMSKWQIIILHGNYYIRRYFHSWCHLFLLLHKYGAEVFDVKGRNAH